MAIVENLEVFWNFEKLKKGAELTVYTQGRLTGRILISGFFITTMNALTGAIGIEENIPSIPSTCTWKHFGKKISLTTDKTGIVLV